MGLLIGGYAALARADYPATGVWSYPWSTSTGLFESVGAVCAFDISQTWQGTPTCENIVTPSPVVSGSVGTYQVKVVGELGTSYTGRSTTFYYYCPSGGDLVGTQCVIASCAVGQSATFSWFSGCWRQDGVSTGCSAGNIAPVPATSCSGNCRVTKTGGVNDCTYAAGDGLKAVFCHAPGVTTGDPCNSGDQASLTAPSSPCPAGYDVGSVNGVSGCYPTGSDPSTTTTTTGTQGDITTTTTTKVDPKTNTTTTTTTTTNNVTNTTTTQVVNTPTNPSMPMTGSGDKYGGSGGLGQSPVGSSSGNPSMNPEQNPTCGWPGGPPCKIDESGTPTDGDLTSAKSDYETKATEHKNFIESMGAQGSHGLTWDWNTWLPSGSCAPLQYGAAGHYFSIDPCEKLGMVRDLLGFLLYIFGAYVLLGIATQSPGGSK